MITRPREQRQFSFALAEGTIHLPEYRQLFLSKFFQYYRINSKKPGNKIPEVEDIKKKE